MAAKTRLLHRLSNWARRVRWRVWAWRARWALIIVAPLVLLNLLVAVCGSSVVFPLSTAFLRPKAIALGRYAVHRSRCLGVDHPPLAPLIARAETKHGLPRGLLAAVVEVESNGRVHRISPAGAMGPGQLTDGTARALRVDDPFDSVQNLDGSARYLAAQLSRFHDVRLAAAAYNAGPGSIVARTVPRNGETEIYVDRVMRAYRKLHPPERPVARRERPGPANDRDMKDSAAKNRDPKDRDSRDRDAKDHDSKHRDAKEAGGLAARRPQLAPTGAVDADRRGDSGQRKTSKAHHARP